MPKNLYDTLNINKDCSKDAIKKGYRKMSKKYHPDKGGNAESFREISLAYNVLSDDEKRKVYDETGKIVEEKPDNFYAKLGELLKDTLIVSILKSDDLDNEDIIKDFKGFLKSQLKEFEEGLSRFNKHIKKLNKSLKRINRKKKQKLAIIEMTIESAIAEIENRKMKLEDEIEFFKKAYDVINRYSYKIDKTINSDISFFEFLQKQKQ